MPAAASFLSPEEARAGAVLRGMRRGAEALTGAALLEAHGRRLLSQAAAAAEARRVRRGRIQEKRQSREKEREAAAAAAVARSSSSLSPSARPFTPASPDGATAAAASKRRRTPPRGAAAVGDGDRALSDAASVRAQVAAAMASVLDQGAVLVAPALPGPPPLKNSSSRKGRKGKGKNSSSAMIASSFSRWAQGVAGLGTLAALSGLPRLIVPLPVAEAAAKLFPSSGSSDSSSSFVLPAGPPPCVALLGGKGSDGNLINVGARLAPVLAEEFVKAVATARARAAAAAEGGSINGADEEEGGATTMRRKSKRATAAASTTATAGASPAVSVPASPAKKNNSNNSNGNSGTAADEIKTEAALVAEALRDAGNAAFRSGDFASAVAHYSAAAAADPTCPLALSNRAAAHLKLLEYEAAERDATLALQLKSDQPKALLRRGIARAAMSTSSSNGGALVDERRERQLLAGARGDLEAVLALEPGNRQARAELEALEVMMRVKEGGERGGDGKSPNREEAAAAGAKSRSEIEPADGEGEEEEKKPARSSAPPSPSMPQEDFFV